MCWCIDFFNSHEGTKTQKINKLRVLVALWFKNSFKLKKQIPTFTAKAVQAMGMTCRNVINFLDQKTVRSKRNHLHVMPDYDRASDYSVQNNVKTEFRHFDVRRNLSIWKSPKFKRCLTIVRHDVLKYLVITIILLTSNKSNAQDTFTTDHLLDRIETQQLKRNNYFIEGIFPSYINASKKFKTRKKDNTIFYNTLISYTLKENYNKFSPQQKEVCDSIIARSIKVSSHFKNKRRNTYNFWRTDTTFRFPYSWWLPLFKGKGGLPDDMDDTVLSLLMNNENKDSAEALHQLIQSYINLKPPLKTTYKVYANDSAYSTWFGKKVPVVFDVSVMCNVLSFIQQNNLRWTKADSASLQYIVQTIQRNDIAKHPAFVSPYYVNTSIILYHLARLMSIKPIKELEDLKPRLVEIAKQRLQSSNNIFEKIMLSSALIKWKANPTVLNVNMNDINNIERNNLPFFVGNIPSYFNQPWKGKFIDLRLLMYNHYCPAWNDCLLLEYLLLSKN